MEKVGSRFLAGPGSSVAPPHPLSAQDSFFPARGFRSPSGCSVAKLNSEGYNACHRDGVRWGRGYKCPWFPSSWENGQPHYELWILY